MKKIISLLTCIAIIFGTFSICASAATPNELLSGEPSFIITLFRNILNIFGLQKATDITISGSDEFNLGDEGDFVVTVTARGKKLSAANFAYDIYTYETETQLKDTPVISNKYNNTKNYEIQMPENPGKYFILVVSNDGGYKDGTSFTVLTENGETPDLPDNPGTPSTPHATGTFTYNGKTYKYTDKPEDIAPYLLPINENGLGEKFYRTSNDIYYKSSLTHAEAPASIERETENFAVSCLSPFSIDESNNIVRYNGNVKAGETVHFEVFLSLEAPFFVPAGPSINGYTFLGWQMGWDAKTLYLPGEAYTEKLYTQASAVYMNNKTGKILSYVNIETGELTVDYVPNPEFDPYSPQPGVNSDIRILVEYDVAPETIAPYLAYYGK